MLSLALLSIKAANIVIMGVFRHTALELSKMQDKNCWCSIDTLLEEVVVISSLAFVPIKAANTVIMAWCWRTAQ